MILENFHCCMRQHHIPAMLSRTILVPNIVPLRFYSVDSARPERTVRPPWPHSTHKRLDCGVAMCIRKSRARPWALSPGTGGRPDSKLRRRSHDCKDGRIKNIGYILVKQLFSQYFYGYSTSCSVLPSLAPWSYAGAERKPQSACVRTACAAHVQSAYSTLQYVVFNIARRVPWIYKSHHLYIIQISL